MYYDVEDRNESKTNVAVINRQVWMLGILSCRQLKAFVVKTLGVFLMEAEVLVVPIILEGKQNEWTLRDDRVYH